MKIKRGGGESMSLPSPPKHLCTPQYKGNLVVLSGPSSTQRETIWSFYVGTEDKLTISKPWRWIS
jgi:hypothetical protein